MGYGFWASVLAPGNGKMRGRVTGAGPEGRLEPRCERGEGTAPCTEGCSAGWGAFQRPGCGGFIFLSQERQPWGPCSRGDFLPLSRPAQQTAESQPFWPAAPPPASAPQASPGTEPVAPGPPLART